MPFNKKKKKKDEQEPLYVFCFLLTILLTEITRNETS